MPHSMFVMVRCLVLLVVFGSGPMAAGAATRPAQTRPADSVSPAPFQAALLDLAFEAASSYPIVPHIKNRSRAQQRVVEAALALGDVERALRYTRGIENWRRGVGFGEVAFHLARAGREAEAREHLERAEAVASAAGLADWRRGRIRARIARALAVLGEEAEALAMARRIVGLGFKEAARLGAFVSGDRTLEARLEAGEAELVDADADVMGRVLPAYAAMYRRAKAAPERRARVLESLEASWRGVPSFLRLELVLEMAEQAASWGEAGETRRLLERARAVYERARWAPRRRVEYLGRFAILAGRAGLEAEAQRALGEAREAFEAGREAMKDLHRAGALRWVAEAEAVLGQTSRSHKTYEIVTELGVANPNMRPRITDCVDTCRSMALYGVEPGNSLRKRLESIVERLGEQ